MLKNPAKEMQKYLDQNKRKYHHTKPMKAYRMADEFGKGYEAIEMQKAMKGKKK
jgi:succinylglutamate desuccinylase